MNIAISPLSTQKADVPEAKAPHLHLSYLDGLRGLAALYVVLYHLGMEMGKTALPHWAERVLGLFRYGHFSVDVFIVLSGYCLMLPIAKSGALRGGVAPFLVRRARRILPPYYAALAFSLLLLYISQWLIKTRGVTVAAEPRFDVAGLVSHLLLLHNLSPSWEFQIDGPLWSVATEWQIYFVFAFLLLPLWRRCGVVIPLFVAFLIGMAPHWLLHGYNDRACFWFLGLFGIGMAGALVSFSNTCLSKRVRKLPWGVFALSFGMCVKIMLIRHGIWLGDPHAGWWRIDTVVGMATACFIIACTKAVQQNSRALLVRPFDAWPSQVLGLFSYSLYLTHAQMLVLAHALLLATHVSPLVCFGVLLGGVLPFCLIVAYLFYLGFERPFLSKQAQKQPRLAFAPVPTGGRMLP